MLSQNRHSTTRSDRPSSPHQKLPIPQASTIAQDSISLQLSFIQSFLQTILRFQNQQIAIIRGMMLQVKFRIHWRMSLT